LALPGERCWGIWERVRDKIDIASLSRSQCLFFFWTNFARDLEAASH
jgi:hypothetical protein